MQNEIQIVSEPINVVGPWKSKKTESNRTKKEGKYFVEAILKSNLSNNSKEVNTFLCSVQHLAKFLNRQTRKTFEKERVMVMGR